MKLRKLKSNKIILSALCVIALCCAILGCTLLSSTAEAISNVPSATSVGAIYDFDNYCYSATELDNLAKKILPGQNPANYSASTAKFNDLINYATSTAGNSGVPIVSKDLTLKYGRFRFATSTTGTYSDLVWMPVYLSKSKSGEAILTLYLAGTQGTGFAAIQEQSAYTGTASATLNNNMKDQAASSPSNNYGSSWIRSMGVGNGTPYATYASTGIGLVSNPTVNESHKYSNFVINKDFMGEFYTDLASPSEITWQETESYSANAARFTAADSNFASYAAYNWPNEAYGDPAGSYYMPGLFDYSTKTQYNDWQNDKIWLPSLTEVGNADTAGSGPSNYSGIWQLNKYQRANSQKSWLRTAKTIAQKDGNPWSGYTMFAINADGTIGEEDVNNLAAIRPAIHVNLSKIASSGKTTPALNLPEEVTSIYKGNSLGQTLADVSEDQKTWYTPNASKLRVEFWSDENCTRRVQPIDAGTYYMMVTITDTSQGAIRFYNADPEHPYQKIIKFVIEKAQLEVEWTYRTDPENNDIATNQIPWEVHYKDGTVFYDRDQGFIPEIGFYYQTREGGADLYYDGAWPEKVGNYFAYAYIKDENLYNYNYTIVSKNNLNRSNGFYVGYRSFDLPEFCYYSDDAVVNSTNTELTLPYKGKNYVQIKNITPNMTITYTATTEAAGNSIKYLGLNDDGIATFEVSDVAEYIFTVALSETEKKNGYWYNAANPNADDDTDKKLSLIINKAIVTVTFDGLPTSWDSLTDQQFTLNVVGIQSGDSLDFTVSYVKPTGLTTDLTPDENGVYTIREHNVGEYTVVAVISGSGWDDIPYVMEAPAVQKFKITQASSSFQPEFITWQYTVSNTTEFIVPGTGDAPDNAVQLEYTGNFYEFSLQLDEARLRDSYLVRANYSSDAYVKNAGTYCVVVTISAYDKNVHFEPIEGKLYFTINPVLFDMTDVEWSHPEDVEFKYEAGTSHEVLLKNLPDGLIVTYSDNKATEIGTHRAAATFTVSEEFAKNYIAPPEPMYLNWSISETGSATDKKEFGTDFLKLTVTHGGVILATASWDNELKKWFVGGEEYVLAFPYDGVDYTLTLSGEVTGITSWGTPTNNTFINAGEYTAYFNPTKNNDYGDPVFGTIDWTIKQAEIDFSNVRWGYIDENGNEFDIDFDNNPFYFTAKNGTAVKYKVALIGFPEGISVNYTTDSLTEANAKGMAGSTFADIGEYETRLNRNIIFENSAMAANYATTRVPVTISQVQFWKIMSRDYVPLSYDGSWTAFDNRTHNLIDLCGIPFSQLEYFRVEVLFLDKGNNLAQQYDGYKGQEYYGYHAGNYILRFYEYRGINEDGSLKEFPWGSVEIKVDKLDLSVTWDQQGEIPVAKVANINTAGMIETKYTDEVGMTVNEAYIKARPGVTFYAQAFVTDTYKNDLRVVMANNQAEQLEFVYEEPNLTTSARTINPDDIRFDNARIEYTGKDIRFTLYAWSTYSNYLYYEGDSLTQLRVGEYVIYISFKKGVNAYWAGTSQDRSTIERHFYIDSPTSFALDYPLMASDVPCYESGASLMKFIAGRAITLNITNWDVLQDFVTYSVTDPNRIDKGDWLTYTEVGVYKIKFTIPSSSIGYWKDSGGKEEYVFTFEIVPADTVSIANPELVASSQTATGSSINFKLKNEELYLNYCDFSGDDLTQTDIGTYTATLMIKAQYGALKFKNGSSFSTLNFSIRSASSQGGSSSPNEIADPQLIGKGTTENNHTMQYTGKPENIISNWSDISRYVDVYRLLDSVWEPAPDKDTDQIYRLAFQEVGTHTIKLCIKDDYKGRMTWKDGTIADKEFTLTITKAEVNIGNSGVGGDGKFTGPNGDGTDVSFDDFFDYTYYDKDHKEVSPGDLKDGEDYIAEITLKPEKEDEFYDSFSNPDAILAAIKGEHDFTYDSGEFDTKLLRIIIIAEAAVLAFLIIATIIVLLVQNKTLKEMENEYDNYDDYEEDDDYYNGY